MDLDVIRATARYHRRIAGLFWILEDELTGAEQYFDPPFRLAIREILKAHALLVKE